MWGKGGVENYNKKLANSNYWTAFEWLKVNEPTSNTFQILNCACTYRQCWIETMADDWQLINKPNCGAEVQMKTFTNVFVKGTYTDVLWKLKKSQQNKKPNKKNTKYLFKSFDIQRM